MRKYYSKIIIALVCIIFIGVVILLFLHTNYYQSKLAAKRLVVAIEKNEIQVAESIIEQYPDSVNSLPTIYPRWWQLINEHPEVYYPLQEACYWGRYEIVELLIDNGADCNLSWKGIESSKSPLICAVLSESEATKDIVKLLLNHGADVKYVDEHGKTAYDYSVENGDFETAELLK